MTMLKGTIIENSLKDKNILQSLEIEKTWQDGSWTLYNVLIEQAAALPHSAPYSCWHFS